MRDQVAVPQLMFLLCSWSRSPFPSMASHERGPQALTRKHRTIMGEFSEYLRVLSDVTETERTTSTYFCLSKLPISHELGKAIEK